MRKQTIFATIILSTIILALIFIFRSSESKDIDKQSNRLTVSILPIKYLVDKITGGQFEVDVMVPPGVNPESYEPTPQQILALNNSSLIFTIGLIDFENTLLERFDDALRSKTVNLSRGIKLLSGHCSHIKHMDDGAQSHHHGVDPHIWTSPRALKIMAKNIFEALSNKFPDSNNFEANYTRLIELLNSTDQRISESLDSAKVKLFLIYHPALTYYSNDYGIEQLSIEQEGKEPSAEHLKHVIDYARANQIKTILLQNEYSRSIIEVVSRDIGAEIVVINPLKEDVVENIISITREIVLQQR